MNTGETMMRPHWTLAVGTRRASLLAAALVAFALLGLAPRALRADPTDGEQTHHTYVMRGYADIYRVKFNGGEQGDVHVYADDDSDNAYLEIKVYDPEGVLVTRDFGDVDHSPACSFNVGSEWSWRVYTIKVVNFSGHDIDYTIHCF